MSYWRPPETGWMDEWGRNHKREQCTPHILRASSAWNREILLMYFVPIESLCFMKVKDDDDVDSYFKF